MNGEVVPKDKLVRYGALREFALLISLKSSQIFQSHRPH